MIFGSLVKRVFVSFWPLKANKVISGAITLPAPRNKPLSLLNFNRSFRSYNIRLICSAASETGTNLPIVDRAMEKTEDLKVSKNEVDREKEMEKEILEKVGTPPEKPLPGDCCGNGCTNCVWDMYFDELEQYNKRKEAMQPK
ncbi:hypothetical protein O6H91_23G033100 [Diphasiastrum complanatum]|uniref:Uncharacterized protein n=1 Tax=Diphasiastrum complanatum TaxID=34168 RepID=A0ACC2A9U3_DIPCM|nr:hypothetical protein O6H91_23G033100 [Diphasiastrum complanatum]